MEDSVVSWPGISRARIESKKSYILGILMKIADSSSSVRQAVSQSD